MVRGGFYAAHLFVLESWMIKGNRKYSLTIKRHRTSISLEEPFFEALGEVAGELHKTVPELIGDIDKESRETGLSSAVRLYLLDYYRAKAARNRVS